MSNGPSVFSVMSSSALGGHYFTPVVLGVCTHCVHAESTSACGAAVFSRCLTGPSHSWLGPGGEPDALRGMRTSWLEVSVLLWVCARTPNSKQSGEKIEEQREEPAERRVVGAGKRCSHGVEPLTLTLLQQLASKCGRLSLASCPV